jgi:hypothetical protein
MTEGVRPPSKEARTGLPAIGGEMVRIEDHRSLPHELPPKPAL